MNLYIKEYALKNIYLPKDLYGISTTPMFEFKYK